LSGHLCDHHQIAQVAEVWTWGMPLSIFTAAIAGSLHCAGMCSGLVGAMTSGPRSRLVFHLGRGFSYIVLGVLAGSIGHAFLPAGSEFQVPSVLVTAAAVFFAGSLIFVGLRLLKNGGQNGAHFSWPEPFERFFSGLRNRVLVRVPRPGQSHLGMTFLSGMSLVLLPCGWLYAFVIGAASTGSALRGGVSMAAFFIATIPALELTLVGARTLLRPLAQKAPRLPGFIFLFAGLVTLVLKIGPRFL
jgi:uncharacterized protein